MAGINKKLSQETNQITDFTAPNNVRLYGIEDALVTPLSGWIDPADIGGGGGDFSDGGEAGGADRTLGNTDNYDLGFLTNNLNRLQIQNDGKIGIGISTPGANLHIGSTAASIHAETTVFIAGGSGSGTATGPLFIRRDDAPIAGGIGHLAAFARINSNVAAWYMGVNTSNQGVLATNNSDLILGTQLSTTVTEVMRIDNTNKYIGIGTGASPTAMLDINSDILRLRTPKTPASAGDSGNQGDIAWDSNYIYICTASNTWKRAAIATW